MKKPGWEQAFDALIDSVGGAESWTWQDMPTDEVFQGGYEAGLSRGRGLANKVRAAVKKIDSLGLKDIDGICDVLNKLDETAFNLLEGSDE